MITKFYFDHDILSDGYLNTLPVVNDFLLENWRLYGALGVDSREFPKLITGLSNVPPKYKQKWALAISKNKRFNATLINPVLSECTTREEIERNLNNSNISVGIIQTELHEYYDGNFNNVNEIVSPASISESYFFKKSKEHCSKDLTQNECVNKIWNERFQSLVEHSKVITIIDRYSVLNAIEDHKGGKKTSLETFLSFLSQFTHNIHVSLLSACNIHGHIFTAREVTDYLTLLRGKPNIGKNISLQVSLCKNKIFKDEAHDRMIRLDLSHVIQIGTGLEIFRKKAINKQTFTIKDTSLSCFNDAYATLNKNREPGFTSL
ncbi:MIT C-terminal domain-containing protein [Aeromonas media]|uniref:MIT C-terminal domain-containing protein n=1 Tax=Aeromonas media TaxID=651 RepID=UPI0013968C09|nr:MIT C-terminal domain-containing protein [Aeromonas media]